MKDELHRIGDCILCGRNVFYEGKFYETGEGFCHQACMSHGKRAR